MLPTVVLLCSLLFALGSSAASSAGSTDGGKKADAITVSSDDWDARDDWNRLYKLMMRRPAAGDSLSPSARRKKRAATKPAIAFQERRIRRGGFDSLMGYGFTGFDRRRREFDSLHGFGFDGFY